MPTYEYVCSSCANQWEEIQKISEPALELCPKCHQSTARRQISGGRFILKGGGWYADLYSSTKPGKKDDAKSTSTSTDAKSSSDSSGSSSSGSDASSAAGSSSSGSSTSSPATSAPASTAPTTPR